MRTTIFQDCVPNYKEKCMATRKTVSAHYCVPSRRQEDHIRELCTRVASASQSELAGCITELQTALREYALRIENKAIKDILKGLGKPDRRRR